MNRSAVKMKLMYALIISLLVEKLKPGIQYKSVLTTEFSFSAIILALILFSLFKRVCLWVVKFGQWRKKWTIDSISFPQLHKGSTEFWILCLNLCSFKWLKPILWHGVLVLTGYLY